MDGVGKPASRGTFGSGCYECIIVTLPMLAASLRPSVSPRRAGPGIVRVVTQSTAEGPERLLAGLNERQREAVLATRGPVAIHAGAGTGKTRVISHRAAYAIETGVVRSADVLVVTFTDKAAGEMAARLAALGHQAVTARTFHAHALSQLRHFWPSRHDAAPLPAVLTSKTPILGPIGRRLPGGYRFTPLKDLADEIEWAKRQRVGPRGYAAAAAAASREPPIPADLMAGVFAAYEQARERTARLDFDDMLTLTVDLLEADAEARSLVQSRKSWFSVDEYQDTNPLQERLLELWLGERDDLCVVGDRDQTIYTFSGASSSFLVEFAGRHPGARVIDLTDNYRSTPQVLALANRLIAATGRSKALHAARRDGPPPTIRRYADAAEEADAIVARVGALIADGVAASEIAVLTRINAQLPTIEAALTSAGIAYLVGGGRFWERREVREALRAVRRTLVPGVGPAFVEALRALLTAELGHDPDVEPDGREARERAASIDTILEIASRLAATEPALDAARYLADLDARARAEADASVGEGSGGVALTTLHGAKGLEWDAVFLPMLEEGGLPIHHAFDDRAGLEEERRLLYVGITRARVHLVLSWAERRPSASGAATRRRPSRFLADLRDPSVAERRPRMGGRVRVLPDAVAEPRPRPALGDDALRQALRAWRSERARADGVPAYVVAHDATIAAIVEARPRSTSALRGVKGMGPTKLDRYGEEILEITRRVD